MPHPYPDGVAEKWIGAQQAAAQAGQAFTFAVTLAGTRTPGREVDPTDTGHVIGSIEIRTLPEAGAAELGYWIGVAWWNKGFATEAALRGDRFCVCPARLSAGGGVAICGERGLGAGVGEGRPGGDGGNQAGISAAARPVVRSGPLHVGAGGVVAAADRAPLEAGGGAGDGEHVKHDR